MIKASVVVDIIKGVFLEAETVIGKFVSDVIMSNGADDFIDVGLVTDVITGFLPVESYKVWILAEGRWNDDGVWVDTAKWID